MPHMDVPTLLLFLLLAWLALVGLGWAIYWWLRIIAPVGGTGGNDPVNGFLWVVAKAMARFIHRAKYAGLEHIPPRDHKSGLIIISNHTGAVDPVLIQARCSFFIRWMMAFEMMSPALDFIWRRDFIIPVDRYRQDPASLREALRHVKNGGVLGIFPEGRIVNPPGEVRPFYPGAGLIIAKCRVPVLLVWISGTPAATGMLDSLLTPSRARVQFIGMLDFSHIDDAKTIAQTLRERIAQVSGWPMNDEELRPGGTANGGTIPPPKPKRSTKKAHP